MNQVTLIGNLGADPVLRKTPSGNPVLNFNLAVDRRSYKTDSTGNKILTKDVDWIPCVIWNSKAEACSEYLQKGSKVAVTGSLRQRTYEFEGRKNTIIEVKVQEVQFLSKIRNSETQS